MTWKAKKKSRNVSKYKNNKSPKKEKKKVINTESNVTLKLIYKCFVVGNCDTPNLIDCVMCVGV